jgi:hypothetical protein
MMSRTRALRGRRRLQFSLDGRRGIQAACFEQARDQRHARRGRHAGPFGHVPQPGMGGEVAVVVAERLQALAQELEVFGLLGGDADPVGVILLGQAAEAGSMIDGQIDGGENSMCTMACSSRARPSGVCGIALLHLFGGTSSGFSGRPQASVTGVGVLPIELAGLPVSGKCCGQRHFFANFGNGQCLGQAGKQRFGHGAGLV